MLKVSPSILSADFAELSREIRKVEQDAAMLHIDVMDGHFVPNISIGIPVVASVRKCTGMFLDVHLMISRPQDYFEEFSKAGADLICFHYESECDVAQGIEKIHSLGRKAAVALKPGTPAEVLFPYLSQMDMALVMTVEPGFGGQAFMPEMLSKVSLLREEAQRQGLSLDIQVDGGIQSQTGREAVAAGANVLVAGSYVFGAASPAQAVRSLL